MGMLHRGPIFGLLLVFGIWMISEKGEAIFFPCGPNPPCNEWEVCDYFRTTPECVMRNDCSGPESETCPDGEICCGHGHNKCMCAWPKVRNKDHECVDCVCPTGEYCTPQHGKCVCGDGQVRDEAGNCVDCNATLICPKCPIDQICTVDQGAGTTTCECLPGSVLNGLGECVWCSACPTCPINQICVTTGFSEPYCACPPGTNMDATGNCIPCPVCPPDCEDQGKVCVVIGNTATCGCPGGTIPHGTGCLYVPNPQVKKMW